MNLNKMENKMHQELIESIYEELLDGQDVHNGNYDISADDAIENLNCGQKSQEFNTILWRIARNSEEDQNAPTALRNMIQKELHKIASDIADDVAEYREYEEQIKRAGL